MVLLVVFFVGAGLAGSACICVDAFGRATPAPTVHFYLCLQCC